MTFIWPWMLLTLLLLPIFVLVYLRLLQKRREASSALGSLGAAQNSTGSHLRRRRHIPPLFFFLALALLLFSLARPQLFVDLPRVEGTVILAFDISNSMNADDLQPARIEVAKTAAVSFVENQPSTIKIGVVAFSGGGLVVQPPTADKAAVLATIERLTPQGGTSLGQGIFSALNAVTGEAIPVDLEALEEDQQTFDLGYYPSAVVLLLTDGENTELPDPLQIAQLAADAGVRIYPVGIGSAEGALLEIEGYNIMSRLDEGTLQEIARLTNGAYYRAEDEASLQEIYENVDLQLTISGEKMEVTAIFAGVSLLLLLIGTALTLFWFGRMPA
jgi:Ca-activated chloride channel family protein